MAYPKQDYYFPGLRSPVRGIAVRVSRFLLSDLNTILTDGECTLSLNLEQKKAVVAEVGNKIAEAEAIIIAEYRGLGVSQMTQLRAKTRESGIYFRVLKNTLARRAVADTPYADLAKYMVGPLVYGIGSDPVKAAKVLHEFSRTNEKLVIKIGAMGGKLMSSKDISALAVLPSRDELLSQLLGTMQAPIAKFVRTLNEVPARFVRGMAAVRDQK